MKITIEPTQEFFMAGDVMVRMWWGSDDTGIPVVALVAGVSGPVQGFDLSEKLVSIPPPNAEDAIRWADEVWRRTLRGGEPTDVIPSGLTEFAAFAVERGWWTQDESDRFLDYVAKRELTRRGELG